VLAENSVICAVYVVMIEQPEPDFLAEMRVVLLAETYNRCGLSFLDEIVKVYFVTRVLQFL